MQNNDISIEHLILNKSIKFQILYFISIYIDQI